MHEAVHYYGNTTNYFKQIKTGEKEHKLQQRKRKEKEGNPSAPMTHRGPSSLAGNIGPVLLCGVAQPLGTRCVFMLCKLDMKETSEN